MNAIDLLTRQHRHIEHLFDQLARVRASDAVARGNLFARIADALALHSELEEEFLYPRASAFRHPDAQAEALAGHQVLKELIADLLQCEPSSAVFETRIFDLRNRLETHVEEEESELFPALDQLLDESELLELGLTMAEHARERGVPPDGEVTPALEPTLS